MNKVYHIKNKVDAADEKLSEIPQVEVSEFPWAENGFRPQTKVKVCYTETHLDVYFKTWEQNVTVKYFQANDPVSRDSCVEFFLNPKPRSSNSYLNFEVNAAGTMLLGYGDGRHGRVLVSPDKHDLFQVTTSLTTKKPGDYQVDYWTAAYSIPLTFLQEFYGELYFQPGVKMKGNFYKCGDDTAKPHYGCWNLIEVEKPDFHRPEFLGELILV